MPWLILIVIIIAVIVIAVQSWNRKMDIEYTKEQQNDTFRRNRVEKTADLECTMPFNSGYHRFVADDVHKKVYFADGTDGSWKAVIPYREITGYQVFRNNYVTDSFGSALTGAVIAGTTGAIVGAAAGGDTKIGSYRLVIYRRNVSHPKYEITFFDFSAYSAVSPSSAEYQRASRFTEDVIAVLEAIIAGNDMPDEEEEEEQPRPAARKKSSTDSTARLRTLKEAYEADLITLEEYEKKKAEILRQM